MHHTQTAAALPLISLLQCTLLSLRVHAAAAAAPSPQFAGFMIFMSFSFDMSVTGLHGWRAFVADYHTELWRRRHLRLDDYDHCISSVFTKTAGKRSHHNLARTTTVEQPVGCRFTDPWYDYCIRYSYIN
ncbi:hypothetical protein COO60DRAFT_349213 [Scenedesmus sp. NREL 46B-D3]|nr:hypothetical protein COO60DRAFT_349213 [Scenedesmus sp. NREL 46B-D3]